MRNFIYNLKPIVGKEKGYKHTSVYSIKNRGVREAKNRQDKEKTQNKMVETYPSMSESQ